MLDFLPPQMLSSDYGGYHRAESEYSTIRPETPEELRAAVIEANRQRRSIRIRGNAHSMNGLALPRRDELLLSTTALDEYCFCADGAIRVGAGAAIWDVQALLHGLGFELLVCNDGNAAAPTIGGFVAAGGFGATSWQHGGFWETVLALTIVSGDGRMFTVAPGDDLFPWLFGSMGQLSIVTDATLRIRPREGLDPAYPLDETGRVPASAPAWDHTVWFTAFVPKPGWGKAKRELAAIVEQYADVWTARIPYAYYLPFKTFNPPLIHPSAEDLVAVGVWGEAPSSGFDYDRLRELDAAVTGWIRGNPRAQRYAQAELLFEDFDYAAHFGDRLLKLRELKQGLDPLHLLTRGVVPPG